MMEFIIDYCIGIIPYAVAIFGSLAFIAWTER